MMNTEPKYLSPDEIKSRLVAILSVFSEFCINNGLRYYLAYGTLLGAVRHQGFIPWDDDIDVWMPRPDFIRFKDSFHHEIYTFHSMDTDEEWPLNSGKVCDERYCAIESFGKDFGLYIDVFALDGMPDDESRIQKHFKSIRRLEELWSNQLFTRKLSLSIHNSFSKNIKIITGIIVHCFIPFNKIRIRLIKLYQKYDYESSNLVCSICNSNLVLSKDTFEPCDTALFEGKSYRIPNKTDLFLKLRYNNYWILPPKEEQVSHGIKAYLKNTY